MKPEYKKQVAKALLEAAATLTASGLTAYLHPEVQKLRRHIEPPSSLIVYAPKGKEVADRLPDLFEYWLSKFAYRWERQDSDVRVKHAGLWRWLNSDRTEDRYSRTEAFRALGLSEERLPSVLFMEQYQREPIVKNEWLVHFTKDALSIAQQGFIKGIPDYDKLGLTTRLPEEMKEKGGFNFAYRTKDDRFISVAQRGWHGWRFGEEVVVFRANGYAVWHRTDEQQEVVFWGKTARDIVPVRLQPDGWTVLSKSGAKVFSSRDTEDEGLWRCVQWVKANYDQYRKKLTANTTDIEVYVHSDGDYGTGTQIVATLEEEPIGHIDVYSSPSSLNSYLKVDLVKFIGLPRGKIGYLGGIELPSNVRNKGVGRKAVSLMLQEAKKLGLSGVALLSTQSASGFWKKMGWEIADADTEDYFNTPMFLSFNEED
jgi:predicted acetyltransferase